MPSLIHSVTTFRIRKVGGIEMRRTAVAVVGYSGDINEEPVKSLTNLCLELGRELGKRYVVFTGGRNGVMELVARGVKEVGGISVGILPWDGSDANEYNSVIVSTGLDFQMRSFIMIKSVDVVISVGGEIGTAIEILAAYANMKPIILVRNTGGWTDRIVSVLIDGLYLDNRKLAPVLQAYTVNEVIELIERVVTSK